MFTFYCGTAEHVYTSAGMTPQQWRLFLEDYRLLEVKGGEALFDTFTTTRTCVLSLSESLSVLIAGVFVCSERSCFIIW